MKVGKDMLIGIAVGALGAYAIKEMMKPKAASTSNGEETSSACGCSGADGHSNASGTGIQSLGNGVYKCIASGEIYDTNNPSHQDAVGFLHDCQNYNPNNDVQPVAPTVGVSRRGMRSRVSRSLM